MFFFRAYKFLTALYYVNTITQTLFLTQPPSYETHHFVWLSLYICMSVLVALNIKNHIVDLFAIHSTGVFCIYITRALQLEGSLEHSYSQLQIAFDQTHQNEDNCSIHYFTIYMSWFSILGLIHRHVISIDPFVGGCMLFAKYNLVVYSVDDPYAFWIAWYSAAFLAGSMVLFVVSDTHLMNTKKYIGVLIASVALQEWSHVIYREPALMYQYDTGNPFWVDLLLHGWFLIPLVMKWIVYPL